MESEIATASRKKSMEAHFNPQDTIRHITTLHNLSIADLGVAPLVVVGWGRRLIELLASQAGGITPEHWFHRESLAFFTGELHGKRVSFAQMPVGAAGTIMFMEEMIACGAHTFIGLGWAGSLQMDAPVGSFFVPTSCLSEEGTSAHYLDPSTSVEPDPALAVLLQQAAEAQGGRVLHRKTLDHRWHLS